jgi:diaminopimelate epimerase
MPGLPGSLRGVKAGDGVPFLKGHGTGNDFVVLPDPDGELELTPDLVRRLCDRRFGIGADGVLRVVRSDRLAAAPADSPRWFMDYHNADGSIAEMCGNGVRVYSRYLVDAGWEKPGEIELATRGGVKRVRALATGDITVAMGQPERGAEPAKVSFGARAYEGIPVSMGNPHLVVELDAPTDVAGLDLSAEPEVSAEIFPTGVNVEFFVRVPVAPSGEALEMRVHERGVGETLSCGTGACAVAVAAAGQPGPPVEVRVPGGRLQVHWTEETVLLSGPAELVAEGRWLG